MVNKVLCVSSYLAQTTPPTQKVVLLKISLASAREIVAGYVNVCMYMYVLVYFITDNIAAITQITDYRHMKNTH